MLEPVECSICQNSYCKKCIKQNNDICPNRCGNSDFKDVLGKKNLITKFKFKCIKGCGSEIAYDDIINHYNNGCKKGEKIVKFLDTNEVKKIRENNGKIQYLSSKI